MKPFFVERRNPSATANHVTNKGTKKKPRCMTCGLKKKVRNCRIGPCGNLKGSVLVVYGTVSQSEDRKGKMKPDWILEMVASVLKRKVSPRDMAFVRAVRCHSESPSDKETISCSEHLYKMIEEGNFTNIVLVGKNAVTSFFSYQDDNKGNSYARIVGKTVPDLRFDVYVSVVNIPGNPDSYHGKDKMETSLFKSRLQAALPYIGKDIPKMYKNYKKYLKPLNEEEAVKELKAILAGKYKDYIAFDYETTGLRPFEKGHQILCCGIAISLKKAIGFMLTRKTVPLLKRILRNPDIPKVAANIKFEHKWSKQILHCTVNNWLLDVVLMAHVLDNRARITNVKVQTFFLTGIYNYEAAVAGYISASKADTDKYGANAFNTMNRCPEQVLLSYVCMDALFERWIADDQLKQVEL